MSPESLSELAAVMPIASMLLFLAIFALVLIYVLTDRRSEHLASMQAKALDDARPAPLEHDHA